MIQEISSDATEFYELVKLDQYTEDMDRFVCGFGNGFVFVKRSGDVKKIHRHSFALLKRLLFQSTGGT